MSNHWLGQPSAQITFGLECQIEVRCPLAGHLLWMLSIYVHPSISLHKIFHIIAVENKLLQIVGKNEKCVLLAVSECSM